METPHASFRIRIYRARATGFITWAELRSRKPFDQSKRSILFVYREYTLVAVICLWRSTRKFRNVVFNVISLTHWDRDKMAAIS